MSNTDNPRRALAIAIAMGAHFCNIDSTEDAVAAYERLEQLANADVDADPSGCGFPAWRAIEGESASDLFDNVEGLAKHILSALPEPVAPSIVVEVSGGNVQGVHVDGHADVYIVDYDNGEEGDPAEHPEIPDRDGDRASIWDAGGVNTGDSAWIAKIRALANDESEEPSAALAAVIDRHGDQQWSLVEGPETGRGVEYWYENQAQTHQVYVCIDQDDVVSCELHELEQV